MSTTSMSMNTDADSSWPKEKNLNIIFLNIDNEDSDNQKLLKYSEESRDWKTSVCSSRTALETLDTLDSCIEHLQKNKI